MKITRWGKIKTQYDKESNNVTQTQTKQQKEQKRNKTQGNKNISNVGR